MKLSDLTRYLEERFGTKENRDKHFRTHVTKSGKPPLEIRQKYGEDALAFKMSDIPRKDLYDELADKAARAPITDPDIRGYIDTKGRIQKYNVKTLEFTSYVIENGEPINITYYPMSANIWEKNKESYHPYKEKLTPEKDCK